MLRASTVVAAPVAPGWGWRSRNGPWAGTGGRSQLWTPPMAAGRCARCVCPRAGRVSSPEPATGPALDRPPEQAPDRPPEQAPDRPPEQALDGPLHRPLDGPPG